jgi:diguanylate cyclase (GGDEF)-like protein
MANSNLVKSDKGPGNTGPLFRLSVVLGTIFAAITVTSTLITAWALYRSYDNTLTEEFQARVISDIQQFSLQIDKSLQSVQQQVNLLALDNSIKVTLMLDVDAQLVERLDAQRVNYPASIHYIEKPSGEIVMASKQGEEERALIDRFHQGGSLDGQFFQSEDGATLIGFSAPVTRRDQQLGFAGVVYQVDFSELLPFSNEDSEPLVFLRDDNDNLLVLRNGQRLWLDNKVASQLAGNSLHQVNLPDGSGYAQQLADYPHLYYFVPDRRLRQARNRVFASATLMSLIGSSIGILVGVLLAGVISRPLTSLADASRKIADGDSNLPVPQQSRILEIQDFARSLLKLVRTIKTDEQRIKHQANYDALSGLPNRNLFVDRFNTAIGRAERDHSRIALLFIDLDQFKYVNDTMGHPAGDQLLQIASQRLKKSVRKSDTVARLGGDEFTVLIPDLEELGRVESVVNKILQLLAEPFDLDDHEAFVSASIGVTIYPDDAGTTEDLLRNADSAMYRAKEKGRNNAQFFTVEMNQHAMRRRTLESELRKAVELQELSLAFQPVYHTQSGHLMGAEALLRWESKNQGTVSPAEFIPLAEECGLILPIGEWVMHQACQTAAQWQKSGLQPLHIAVNLSSRQFQRGNVPELVRVALEHSGLPADQLTLEITESLLLKDDQETLNSLYELRELGCDIAIDDFGTGFSSLSYLKRFPVNIIKIDQSFVRDIPHDADDTALVESILSIGRSLKMGIIAEGVENQQQLSFLKKKRCSMAQGFFLSKPLKLDDFNQLLVVEHQKDDSQLDW